MLIETLACWQSLEPEFHVALAHELPLLAVYWQEVVSIPEPESVAVPPTIVPVPFMYEPDIVNPDKVVAPTDGGVMSTITFTTDDNPVFPAESVAFVWKV